MTGALTSRCSDARSFGPVHFGCRRRGGRLLLGFRIRFLLIGAFLFKMFLLTLFLLLWRTGVIFTLEIHYTQIKTHR